MNYIYFCLTFMSACGLSMQKIAPDLAMENEECRNRLHPNCFNKGGHRAGKDIEAGFIAWAESGGGCDKKKGEASDNWEYTYPVKGNGLREGDTFRWDACYSNSFTKRGSPGTFKCQCSKGTITCTKYTDVTCKDQKGNVDGGTEVASMLTAVVGKQGECVNEAAEESDYIVANFKVECAAATTTPTPTTATTTTATATTTTTVFKVPTNSIILTAADNYGVLQNHEGTYCGYNIKVIIWDLGENLLDSCNTCVKMTWVDCGSDCKQPQESGFADNGKEKWIKLDNYWMVIYDTEGECTRDTKGEGQDVKTGAHDKDAFVIHDYDCSGNKESPCHMNTQEHCFEHQGTDNSGYKHSRGVIVHGLNLPHPDEAGNEGCRR